MMITQILKKDYDKLYKQRARSRSKSLGYLIFKGEDGKYYKTSESSAAAVKEITVFNRNFRSGIDNQIKLI